MGNPFFSGRIPQNLHDRIQQHCSETGETKTQVLVNALAAYLNHPVKESPSPVTREEFTALQEQVIALEKSIQLRNQPVISTDNKEDGLELICIEGRCPSCHADEMSAIPYEFDNEVRFDCLNCGWQKLYPLSAAKELGYVPYLSDEVDNSAVINADNVADNKLAQDEAPGELPEDVPFDEGDTFEWWGEEVRVERIGTSTLYCHYTQGDPARNTSYIRVPFEEARKIKSELTGDLPSDLPEFLNAANLARRLGVSKSVISRRKSQADFEEWTRTKDPDGIGWRFPGKGQRFFSSETAITRSGLH